MASERIQNILLSVSNKVQRLMEVDRFYAALYDPARAKLEFPLVVGSGSLVETSQTPWTMRPYRGHALLPDLVIAQEAPLLLEHDLAKKIEEAGVEYWPPDGHPLSWLGAPMIFEEQLMGVLVVENRRKPGAFGDSGVRVLSTIARQASMAIQNARLYERLERKLASLSALNEIGQQLTAGIRLGEPEILELIYGQASQVMDTDNMYIALYDEATDTVGFGLALLHGRRVDVATETGWQPRSGGQGRTEWIIRHRKPLLNSTWAETEEWYKQAGHKNYVEQPLASWIGLPMITGDKVLGVIATYNTQEYAYGEDDLQVLSLMASQAAIALDNARLLQGVKWAQQLAALQEIGVTITSGLELTETLGSIAESANKITSADFSTLFAYDSKREKFEIGIRKGKIEVEPSMPSNTGLSARIAKTQGTIFAENAERQPGVKPTFIKNKKIKSFAGVPLIIKGRTVGILYVNYLEPHRFLKEERETLRLLANQAAVAIENAKLYDHLEEMVEERTQQLGEAQQRIMAAERLAAANTVSSEFAHRLNNLAGTIPVRVDMARGLLNPHKGRDRSIIRILDGIQADTRRLLRAAEDIRKGSAALHLELIDLNNLITLALRNAYVPPSIHVSTDLESALPPIKASIDHLNETLSNLISNAVDAMPGGGKLELKTRRVTAGDRRWVRLEVTDTGKGIPPEGLKDVFQLFYTTKPRGLGYGLWRDRNLAEHLSGKLEVESQPGEGATFTLTLPAAE